MSFLNLLLTGSLLVPIQEEESDKAPRAEKLQTAEVLEFRIVAEPRDGLDIGLERKKLDAWLAKNPSLDYKTFNLLSESAGGPRAGYRWYLEMTRSAPAANQPKPPAQYELVRLEKEEIEGKESKWVFRAADLDYALESPEPDPIRGPEVLFGMKEHRKADFEAFTRANFGRRLAMIVNGEIRSAPVIQSAMPGQGRITGNFTSEEVQALIRALNRASEGKVSPAAEPDHIKVQHCLIGFKGSLPGKNLTRTKEEAEKLAKDLFERAKKGEDFDAIVKQHTDDTHPGIYGMSNRGKLRKPGYYPRERMVPAFGDTGFPLQVGEVGLAAYDSKKSPYGWHIVKRIE